jgi:hypothetical protein
MALFESVIFEKIGCQNRKNKALHYKKRPPVAFCATFVGSSLLLDSFAKIKSSI